MTNPLLADRADRFELPPFDRIAETDFLPAFETALSEARARVAVIAGNSAPPDFANTIEALELAGESLGRVSAVFFNLTGTDSTPGLEALARDLAPKLSAYGSEITNNEALFARIEALWERRDALRLDPEQMRVLELTRRRFLRAGAALQGTARDRLTGIKSRLASLGTQFGQNLLADERGWVLPLAETDLHGLPAWLVAAARDAGAERGLGGPAITLARSLVVPFLQFSPRRDLRERAFRAWAARGANGGATDNRTIAAEILALRAERAALLGYRSFAA